MVTALNKATRLSMGLHGARAWCHALSRTLEVQHISPNGKPYLERYFAAGWSPSNKRSGPAILLHHFVASDPDEAVYFHPCGWSASLIFTGGYTEERCLADGTKVTRVYHPGDVNVLEADDKHRIDLLDALLSGPLREGMGLCSEVSAS